MRPDVSASPVSRLLLVSFAGAYFTVIEIFTEDRIGVLFRITYGLHQLGLSIHVAKISTNVDQVADVFYVTDQSGAKLSDTEDLESVRIFLLETLAPQSERGERIAQHLH